MSTTACNYPWFIHSSLPLGGAWTNGDCWLLTLTHEITTSLVVPILLMLIAGCIEALMTREWQRSHFLIGISAGLSSIALAAASFLGRLRELVKAPTLPSTQLAELFWPVVVGVAGCASLFFVMLVMIPYYENRDQLAQNHSPTISWGRLSLINLIGGAPLFLSLIVLMS